MTDRKVREELAGRGTSPLLGLKNKTDELTAM
jgi:hypothetical protein